VSGLVAVLKIVRLPDGRWATENGEGVGELTREDVEGMHSAFMLWADLRWRMAERTELANEDRF
jgi:hypothetical protein